MQVKRQGFYKPEEIVQNVEKRVKEAHTRRKPIDYLTFEEINHRESKFYLRKFQRQKVHHS